MDRAQYGPVTYLTDSTGDKPNIDSMSNEVIGMILRRCGVILRKAKRRRSSGLGISRLDSQKSFDWLALWGGSKIVRRFQT